MGSDTPDNTLQKSFISSENIKGTNPALLSINGKLNCYAN